MIKVMYLIRNLSMGGAETLVKDYAINMNRDEFEIVIVTTAKSFNSINEKRILDNKIRIIFLGDLIPYQESDSLIKRILKRFKRYKLFSKLVSKEKPDVIHTHLEVNDYLPWINTNKNNIKLFHTVHSDASTISDRDNIIYKKSTEYLIDKRQMKLIALHDQMEAELKALFYTNEVMVVNNAIDIKRFSTPQKSSNEIKQELGLKNSSFVIGHVGSFFTGKNHSFLIDIFYEVYKVNKNAVLLLIGKGDLEQFIKDKVLKLGLEKSVYFLKNRGDIPELLSVMDVFVFPSIIEGFGNVVIEAQAAGVKTIASNNVPSRVKQTDYLTFLDLEDPIDVWVNEILKPYSGIKEKDDLYKYDIAQVINILENEYRN